MNDDNEVERSESERYYDEHIAPKLMELARECEDHGMSLVAVCEWKPGETRSTRTIREGAGAALRLTDAAAVSVGNLDKFMMHMERRGRKYGHSSIYLSPYETQAY